MKLMVTQSKEILVLHTNVNYVVRKEHEEHEVKGKRVEVTIETDSGLKIILGHYKDEDAANVFLRDLIVFFDSEIPVYYVK